VAEDQKHFPFCSNRCKLLDLGAWSDGQYTIEEPIEIDPNFLSEDNNVGSEDT